MTRLVLYNIEYCEGILGHWWEYLEFWRVFHAKKGINKHILNSLKKLNLDVLALVEEDTGSLRSNHQDQARDIEKGLGMNHIVEKIKYPLHGWLRLFHYTPILNKQANAIITRVPLLHTKYHEFHEGTKRMIIDTTIKLPRRNVTLLLAHLALGKRTRKKQLAELAIIVKKKQNPVILMGDFNTYNGEQEIATLLETTQLEDNARIKKTHPSWHPKRRLDYILTTPDIIIQEYKALTYAYSDHAPLYVKFKTKKRR